jgi:hypothetical protein
MNFEQQVLDSLKTGISEVIVTKLGGYNSPLDGVIKDVFETEGQAVTDLLKSVFREVIGSDEFKVTIKQEFQRKVAKNLVGMMEGQVTKAANALRQDPTMRSRMILAIEKIVTDS